MANARAPGFEGRSDILNMGEVVNTTGHCYGGGSKTLPAAEDLVGDQAGKLGSHEAPGMHRPENQYRLTCGDLTRSTFRDGHL